MVSTDDAAKFMDGTCIGLDEYFGDTNLAGGVF